MKKKRLWDTSKKKKVVPINKKGVRYGNWGDEDERNDMYLLTQCIHRWLIPAWWPMSDASKLR